MIFNRMVTPELLDSFSFQEKLIFSLLARLGKLLILTHYKVCLFVLHLVLSFFLGGLLNFG